MNTGFVVQANIYIYIFTCYSFFTEFWKVQCCLHWDQKHGDGWECQPNYGAWKSVSLTTHKNYTKKYLMMLRNSMLSFLVCVDDQNKSLYDEKDTSSVTTLCEILRICWGEYAISFIQFWFQICPLYFFPKYCVCVCFYVCIPKVLPFECKIK